MRGVLQVGQRDVRVAEVPRPACEPGTAIVRVRAAGICGSDLHVYRSERRAQERPSGHEVAGEIVEILPAAGEETVFRAGDLVALDTICSGRACGACRWCAEGAPFHCQHKRSGPDWGGAFAEYIKRDLHGVFKLPPGVSVAEGALVEPLAVAVHAFRQVALQPGESVAVIGAGTIGLCCLIAAQGMGAGDVFVTARHQHQADLARALGAAEVLTDAPQEAAQTVHERTGGHGADVVVETVGGEAPTLNQAWSLVRRRGRVAVLGIFGRPVEVDLGPPLGREVRVCFPVCYGVQEGRHDFQVAIELIAAGRAPVTSLLTHRFALEEATQAFATADDKSTGAVKVQFTQ